MVLPIQDLNVASIVRIPSPKEIKARRPLTAAAEKTVIEGREAVKAVLEGRDSRFLVVIGPCSIHDPESAFDYARRLRAVQEATKDVFVILMRVYFEKPRTTIGWKGLINDPHLNGTYDMEAGLVLGREILLKITEMGIPTASEFLDPIVPQYTSDIVSWAAIGARTTESQTHREMASGLSMPIGFKNGTDGSLQVAMDAMQSARHPHSFLGIDQDGCTAVVSAKGNPWGHIILRGGHKRTNFDPESIADAATRLRAAKLPPGLMVDCSHANSEKKFERQETVWNSLIDQKLSAELKGSPDLIGAMVESNINEGNQPFPNPAGLKPGVSITDACIGWAMTEKILLEGAERLRAAKLAAA
ncbi:3-deoxy-D-arabinoheptulosonate-7-phosphate synthase [Verrucomicrobium sp. GAS474]|uniref:3-deoxy-7-phosphoheptulonate synthase n=1 Tax=Verrucomicrobium sp. GAS474 TaxID=1882831 RepID=UPI00087AF120|nr:3-deoxy-7-phosphoheptulonate synthase [Verrucomicrobium sp. GAS474]SDU17004.1 3-deoxy-D-arabinoheptulosonate-7-phosphate synthase [Verrucomicrobium sp. GAS474]